MNRGRNLLLMIMAATLVTAACAKKPPKTTDVSADPVTSTTAPTDVAAAPRPSNTDTAAYDPLSDPDIAKLNDYLKSQGLLGDVFFDFDKAELREDARERLSRNAQWLREHPQFEVTIEGHCDERGTNEYNLSLAERRAGVARDYITSLGVTSGRLRSISYGEERPQCTASSESCWAMNRRAHFVVTGRGNVG
jgi:peptidoglycan-associated lipoprotein